MHERTFIRARPCELGNRSSIPLLKRRSRLCNAPLLEARRDCRSSASEPLPLFSHSTIHTK